METPFHAPGFNAARWLDSALDLSSSHAAADGGQLGAPPPAFGTQAHAEELEAALSSAAVRLQLSTGELHDSVSANAGALAAAAPAARRGTRAMAAEASSLAAALEEVSEAHALAASGSAVAGRAAGVTDGAGGAGESAAAAAAVMIPGGPAAVLRKLEALDGAGRRLAVVADILARAAEWHAAVRAGALMEEVFSGEYEGGAGDGPATNPAAAVSALAVEGGRPGDNRGGKTGGEGEEEEEEGSLPSSQSAGSSAAASLSRLAAHCTSLERSAGALAGYPGEGGRALVVSRARASLQAAVRPVLRASLAASDVRGVRSALIALKEALGGADEPVESALASARVGPLVAAWWATAPTSSFPGLSSSPGSASLVVAAAGRISSAVATQSALALIKSFPSPSSSSELAAAEAGGRGPSSSASSSFVDWQAQYYASVGATLEADAEAVAAWCNRPAAGAGAPAVASSSSSSFSSTSFFPSAATISAPAVIARMAIAAVGCGALAAAPAAGAALSSSSTSVAAGADGPEGASNAAAVVLPPPSLSEWRLRLDTDGLGEGMGGRGFARIACLVHAADGLLEAATRAIGLAASASPPQQQEQQQEQRDTPTSFSPSASGAALASADVVAASLARPFAWYALQQPGLEADALSAALEARSLGAEGPVGLGGARGGASALTPLPLPLPLPAESERRFSTAVAMLRLFPSESVQWRAGMRRAAAAAAASGGADGDDAGRGGGGSTSALLSSLASFGAVSSAFGIGGATMAASLQRCHALASCALLPSLVSSFWGEQLSELCGRAYSVVVSMHEACVSSAVLAAEERMSALEAAATAAPSSSSSAAHRMGTVVRGSAAHFQPPKGRPATSWMDDAAGAGGLGSVAGGKGGSPGRAAGAAVTGSAPVRALPSHAEVHAAVVCAWGVAADALLLVDALSAAAAAQLEADTPVLSRCIVAAAGGEGALRGASSGVVTAVLAQLTSSSSSPFSSSSSSLSSSSSEPLRGAAGAALSAGGSGGAAGGDVASPSTARADRIRGMVAAVDADGGGGPTVERWLVEARAASHALALHTFRLSFDAALAPLALHLVGLYSFGAPAADGTRDEGDSGDAPQADEEVQAALDGYSAQPSAAVSALCEGLLACARAAAPATHPLVVAATAAAAAAAAAAAFPPASSAAPTGTSVALPAVPPMSLIVASHARLALLAAAAETRPAEAGRAATDGARTASFSSPYSARSRAGLGEEEVFAAEKIMHEVRQSLARPMASQAGTKAAEADAGDHDDDDGDGDDDLPDRGAGDDGAVALLARAVLPLSRGDGLWSWARRSVVVTDGIEGSPAGAAAAVAAEGGDGAAFVSVSEATDVTAAAARLWLHALARAVCALFAAEVLRLPRHVGGGVGGAPVGRGTARKVRSDASYLAAVVRALGAEPPSLLRRAVRTMTGSGGGMSL